jgi:hypothetical protein
MSEQVVARLHRIDSEIARRLVEAGLDVPAKIRAATDKDLREALKGPGVTKALAAVREAYPARK